MSIDHFLYRTYVSIINCDIVARGVITEESMAELQNLLNETIPKTDQEIGARKVIYDLYKKSPKFFITHLVHDKNNSYHYILWTSTKNITHFFQLNKKVYIRWNYDTSLYEVEEYVPHSTASFPSRQFIPGINRLKGAGESKVRRSTLSSGVPNPLVRTQSLGAPRSSFHKRLVQRGVEHDESKHAKPQHDEHQEHEQEHDRDEQDHDQDEHQEQDEVIDGPNKEQTEQKPRWAELSE